jgi:hypothetical protein
MAIRLNPGAYLGAPRRWIVAESNSEASQPLVLEATILLDGVSGRIDHFAVDLKRSDSAVAELGNNTVDLTDRGAYFTNTSAADRRRQRPAVATAPTAMTWDDRNGGAHGALRFHRRP